MFKIFRNRMSAAAIIAAFTVAACCSPSEPTGSCQGPPEEATTPPAAGMNMGQDGDGPPMPMMDKPAKACSLYYLAENDPVPPLYSGIGSAHWYVPAGQAYFDQGLRFFFAFNGRESYRAFREAANEAESNNIQCSACYWAQALPLGVDINDQEQSPYDRREANNALHRAEDAKPSPMDQAIIDALSARNQDCTVKDDTQCQKIRNQAYYDGMTKVLNEFGRDDPNIIALYADSAMNLTPWRYWNKRKGGKPASDKVTDAQTQLERALKFVKFPQNEGPIHLYIHLMEGSNTPGLAKPYADLLAPPKALAPNAGHLVHMPSHIYYRIGDMSAAITANKEAIVADEAYLAKEPNLFRPDGDRYRYDYYLHNIHFLLAAAVLSGDTKEGDINRYAEKLLQSLPNSGSGFRADKFRAMYYLARLDFASTSEIRNFARPDPFEQQPMANLAYQFTQMMADIWDGKQPTQPADKFNDDLVKMRNGARETDSNVACDPQDRLPNNKDLCVAAILDYLGRARTAVLNARWGDADQPARGALEIDRALDYYEPPLYPYPTRQTLASVLIQRANALGPAAGRTDLDEAKNLLLESLNKQQNADPNVIPIGIYPGNGWAYYGLWEIANRYDRANLDQASRDLNDHWFGDPKFQTLDRM